MALHTDTRIYKATYDLTLLITKLVANMPRNYKADFGKELRRQSVGLVMRVYEANTTEDRRGPLARMRTEIEAVNLAVRLAMDLRLISKGQYGQAIALTDSIGKQATAWLKHTERALAAPSSRRQGQCAI
ncbi:four helix bundle protein [Allopusillimonas soli]|uniref:Four helix bundle protein n=1 Tax=Allopusillimonas soli TaxID=659016 RepID=A0A853FKL0_9BURK|nr:four helix bundle protein [Allopusillimonas soli]NYT38911.1 four helix bundle protein [Allopusillimonas soli]TEA70091.1 four helix bundle protein [Allopusillimonas soli]